MNHATTFVNKKTTFVKNSNTFVKKIKKYTTFTFSIAYYIVVAYLIYVWKFYGNNKKNK